MAVNGELEDFVRRAMRARGFVRDGASWKLLEREVTVTDKRVRHWLKHLPATEWQKKFDGELVAIAVTTRKREGAA